MKRCRFIVEQIEECKRLIILNDIPYFRMAFVLLDNAAEILMHRKAQGELVHNRFLRQMNESMTRGMTPAQLKDYQEKVKPRPVIGLKKERIINKYFDEKTKFLSEDRPIIKKTVAALLRSLHKYRNELYHCDQAREEILKSSTILYFEVVCDLLICLPPSSYSRSSSEDYNTIGWKRFFARYKSNKTAFFDEKSWRTIKKKLNKGLKINRIELQVVLKQYLLERLEEAKNAVTFVMQDGLRFTDEEMALKCIQYVESGKIIGLKNREELLKKFKAKYSMKDFDKWEKKIEKFEKINSKIKLFNVFCQIENEFEPLEYQVNNAAAELDVAIQMEIDAARGK